MKEHRHDKRILQIMPTNDLLAVFGHSDGSIDAQIVYALALVEEWDAGNTGSCNTPPHEQRRDTRCSCYRYVDALIYSDGMGACHLACDMGNFLCIVHRSQWDDDEWRASFEELGKQQAVEVKQRVVERTQEKGA